MIIPEIHYGPVNINLGRGARIDGLVVETYGDSIVGNGRGNGRGHPYTRVENTSMHPVQTMYSPIDGDLEVYINSRTLLTYD